MNTEQLLPVRNAKFQQLHTMQGCSMFIIKKTQKIDRQLWINALNRKKTCKLGIFFYLNSCGQAKENKCHPNVPKCVKRCQLDVRKMVEKKLFLKFLVNQSRRESEAFGGENRYSLNSDNSDTDFINYICQSVSFLWENSVL